MFYTLTQVSRRKKVKRDVSQVNLMHVLIFHEVHSQIHLAKEPKVPKSVHH